MMQVELVERASRGDREAFASLAADSADRCYALAYRILRDPHRAQDATQQALLGAWRDLPTLREPERFDAWLHRLVGWFRSTEAPIPTWRKASRRGMSSKPRSGSCRRNTGPWSSYITTSATR